MADIRLLMTVTDDGVEKPTNESLPGTDGGDKHILIPVRCAACAGRARLLDFRHLKKGDHIALGGQHSLSNNGDKQVAFYTHHAIVKEVKPVNLGTAKVTLIHFCTTPFDPDIRIQKTNEILDLRHHEIYRILYRHRTHPPDVIIKRAEDQINENVQYSLFKGNCEHFCNWCCIGNDTSPQVNFIKSTLRDLLNGVMSIVGKTTKLIFKLLILSADDIAKVAAFTCVPWWILFVVTVVLFIYTWYKHRYYSRQLSKRDICYSCCERKKSEYWLRFVACLVYQVSGLGLLTLVIALGASTGVVIAVLSGLIVLSLIVICSVKKIHSIFCSPFQGNLERVDTVDQIKKGDAIYFNQWKLSHAAIVSEVPNEYDTSSDSKTGKIKVIHYILPLFGTGIIDEVDLDINLEESHIFRHDYSGYESYNADEVVERAKKRIGETKFWVFGNRSCHFTHWANVKENSVVDPKDLVQNEESNKGFVFQSDDTLGVLQGSVPINVDHCGYRKHATKTLRSVRANIRDEIHPGQIIEFKYKFKYMYFRLKHKAICTAVTFDKEVESKLTVEVVHFDRDKCVVKDTFTFDLKYENIWVHPVHPTYRFSPDEVKHRATTRIGRTDYSIFSNRSCHLAKEVVMKEDKQLAIHMGDIKPGDVAIITYRGRDQYVVVTEVEQPKVPKDYIEIVHYALNTQTVKKETIRVDLSKDRIYIKDFRGYVTYPRERVVDRALFRVNEPLFNAVSNTSAELAFWAKVVQTPAIVTFYSFGTEGNETGAIRALLHPLVGKPRKGLQKVPAYSWKDLHPGMIIEYKYCLIKHPGILTTIDKTEKCVKVIHCGICHLFATRTIMESILPINMEKDKIMIYLVDPTKANEQQVILQNARERLREQNWNPRNTSWEFCLSCVLRDEQ